MRAHDAARIAPEVLLMEFASAAVMILAQAQSLLDQHAKGQARGVTDAELWG